MYNVVTECIHISQTNANFKVRNGQQGEEHVKQ